MEPYKWYPQRAGRVDLVLPRARATGRLDDPVVRQEIAKLPILTRSAEWTARRARAAQEQGRPQGPEGSLGKLAASHVARAAARVHTLISGADAMLSGEDGPLDGTIAEILGEYVIDIWAGHRDGARTLPWEEDTIVCVFSTTKTMTALSALVLFDRGELSFDDPVTRYWPEYGQNGKASTEIRHFLGHTAGLPGFGEKLTEAQLYDWDYAIRVLERQEPWWQPGELCGYHAITQGFLVGEIVRRITGMSLANFFHENVAAPLGVDFHIGLPFRPDGGNAVRRTDPGNARGDDSGVHARPRAGFARHHAAGHEYRRLAPGGDPGWQRPRQRALGRARADGHRQQGICLRGRSPLARDHRADLPREQGDMDGMGVKHGIGYGLSGLFAEQMPKDVKTCFWGGAGGSTIILDHTNHEPCVHVLRHEPDPDGHEHARRRTRRRPDRAVLRGVPLSGVAAWVRLTAFPDTSVLEQFPYLQLSQIFQAASLWPRQRRPIWWSKHFTSRPSAGGASSSATAARAGERIRRCVRQ